MVNLEREDMVNNLELNKGKLSKLTRKVILVGGIVSTLLTGGCKTKENSSTNPSVTEVTPTPTATPDVASDNEQEEYKYYKIDFTVKVYNDQPQVTIESEKEVEYQNTETPEGGYVNVTYNWEPFDSSNDFYCEERSHYNYIRYRLQYLAHFYLEYDKFMEALENIELDGTSYNYIVDEEQYYGRGSGINYAVEIPQGEENFFMLEGVMNVHKKVKVKSK